MIDPTQLDPVFLNVLFAVLLNILTQIAKRFHTNPRTVFNVLALFISFVYAVIAFTGYQEQLLAVIASIATIIGTAAGIWHLVMRPESAFKKWWNSNS